MKDATSTSLLEAVREGRIDVVRRLLAEGAEVNAVHEDGHTALMEAAWNGHAEIIRELLAAGADPRLGHSLALDFAVRIGTPECVELLIAAGADPNAAAEDEERDETEDDGEVEDEEDSDDDVQDPTMLMEAVRRGDMRIIDILLKAGADLRAVRGGFGVVACAIRMQRMELLDRLIAAKASLDGSLIAAVEANQPELIGRLLALEVPVNAASPSHDTPLSAAAADGKTAIVARLLRAGADVEGDRQSEMAPLERATMDGHAKVVRLLLEADADIRPHPGHNPLLIQAIVHARSAALVKVLLEHGADANESGDECAAPLFQAVGQKSSRIVRLLLGAGADVNVRSRKGQKVVYRRITPGMTTLMLAARGGRADLVSALLDAGADPKLVDARARNAADHAAEKGRVAILGTLQALGVGSRVPATQSHSQALLRAVQAGDAATADAALAAGGDPNAADRRGTLVLIDAGADPNARWTPGSIPAVPMKGVFLSYATPLHDAAAYGCLENVELLLAAGANVDAVDEGGLSAVIAAVNHRQMKVVERLLAAGAKVRADDEPWMAPYHFARAAESPEYRRVIEEINGFIGSPATPVPQVPGVMAWTIRTTEQPDPPDPLGSVEAARHWGKQFNEQYAGLIELSDRILDQVYVRVRAAGCLLLDAGMPLGCGPMVRRLALLPTPDKFAAMITYGVRGNDQELSTADIVGWFRKLDEEHPFQLRGIRFDTVSIEFERSVPHPDEMAQRMCAFCHDLADAETVARQLRSSRRIVFWWD